MNKRVEKYLRKEFNGRKYAKFGLVIKNDKDSDIEKMELNAVSGENIITTEGTNYKELLESMPPDGTCEIIGIGIEVIKGDKRALNDIIRVETEENKSINVRLVKPFKEEYFANYSISTARIPFDSKTTIILQRLYARSEVEYVFFISTKKS